MTGAAVSFAQFRRHVFSEPQRLVELTGSQPRILEVPSGRMMDAETYSALHHVLRHADIPMSGRLAFHTPTSVDQLKRNINIVSEMLTHLLEREEVDLPKRGSYPHHTVLQELIENAAKHGNYKKKMGDLGLVEKIPDPSKQIHIFYSLTPGRKKAGHPRPFTLRLDVHDYGPGFMLKDGIAVPLDEKGRPVQNGSIHSPLTGLHELSSRAEGEQITAEDWARIDEFLRGVELDRLEAVINQQAGGMGKGLEMIRGLSSRFTTKPRRSEGNRTDRSKVSATLQYLGR